MKKSISFLFHKTPYELLQNALSPIEIRKISVNEEDKTISIVVEDDDFAAVIGKKGMNARLNSQLIGHELEVQRMSDYNRTMALQRTELAESDDPTLDEPLNGIEGVNKLIFEHLVEKGYNTQELCLLQPLNNLLKFPASALKEQIRY